MKKNVHSKRLERQSRFTALLFLIAVFIFISAGAAVSQERYAIDASAGCWGEVPENSALAPDTAWTCECWVWLLDDAEENQPIFQSGLTDRYWIGVQDGTAYFTVFQGSVQSSLEGNTALPLGAWSHIASTYGSTGMAIYLNGHLEDSITSSQQLLQFQYPILIGGDSQIQFNGLIDESRISNCIRYIEDFDPFSLPLVDLRVADQQVSGWTLGTDPGDLREAWDDSSLVAIINGAAVTYLENNFQYAVQQYYYGQISGSDEELRLWMTDQGTAADAQSLFHDPAITPFFYQEIDTIGEEARLDTALLWDWVLDFWRDKYYVSVTIGKYGYEEESLQIAAEFAAIVDNNILNSDHLPADENTTALWHFDEGSGAMFADASGNANDGTLTNPAWVTTTPYTRVLYITAAELLDGLTLLPEIDEDDTARIVFSQPVAPVNIHAGNIDDILQLETGQSWLSGAGDLGSVSWNATSDELKISFSMNGGSPTIQDNGKITPNPLRLVSDEELAAGGYRYIRFDFPANAGKPSTSVLPETIQLHAPYPSPFNPTTRISFDLPYDSDVMLRIFDIHGREVQTVINARKRAGSHIANWNAENLSSGVYIISLQTGNEQLIRKAVLLK